MRRDPGFARACVLHILGGFVSQGLSLAAGCGQVDIAADNAVIDEADLAGQQVQAV